MAANSGDDYLSRLNEHENFVLGMTTGVVEQVSSQPILFWKNSYQQGLPFTANPMHLYRGILASCCNMAALTAIQTMSAGICVFRTASSRHRCRCRPCCCWCRW
eukprot:TRINITY_DN1572_c1_g1_i2.p1 TRINITY_DN1572_c1_g1~~TRINITY_DN1572_c1_g1_i2.p1  ORF type:complete len:104 (+),score=7.32 TRINITY_DN1572_c1_g1_i2:111-422(+)